MRDVRRHYGRLLNNQHVEIDHLGRRLELLKIVSGVLLVLLVLIKLSSNACGSDLPNTSGITQECLEKKALYDCDKEHKSNSPYQRLCEDLKFCLKDPVAYQLKKEEKEWKEFMDDLYEYLNFFKNNSLLAGFIAIISLAIRYYNIP